MRTKRLFQGAGVPAWLLWCVAFAAFPVAAIVKVTVEQRLPHAAAANYTASPVAPECNSRRKLQPVDGIATVTLSDGTKATLRLPSNYDPRRAHPLLVVFPAAGFDRFASENRWKLTARATAAGFIIGFTSARPLDRDVVAQRARIVEAVSHDWCVDPKRVVVVGHSDGATTAYGTMLVSNPPLQAKAALLSGASINGQNLLTLRCPSPLDVMIVHGRRDTLFPNFGDEAFSWWKACFGCDGVLSEPDRSLGDCVRATHCKKNSQVVLCKPNVDHSVFPTIGDEQLKFLTNAIGTSSREGG